jgi:chaperone BCS1
MYYKINIDENNIFIIQKLLYHLEINKILEEYKNSEFIFYGILDVRGKKIIFLIPTFSFTFQYKECLINYSYKKNQNSKVERGNIFRMDHIILSCSNLTKLQEFLYEIEKLEFLVPENKLIKYIWRNSYWKYCNGFKRRNLDTLYLPKKDKDLIINEIEHFFNNNTEIYNNLCIPERKVFLFWGIPGSGKTTFIRSIASHFNKNIAIVKNSNDIDDNSLENMIEELPKNSIILFEDIDSLFQGRSNMANTQITFSGLLNFLDGIIDYDKLLVFITTNNLEYIDDALRRRVDIFLEFTYIKKTEIYEMFNNFFKNKYQAEDFYKIIKKEITANSLEKYFIKCIMEDLSPLDNISILYSYVDMIKNIKNQSMYN